MYVPFFMSSLCFVSQVCHVFPCLFIPCPNVKLPRCDLIDSLNIAKNILLKLNWTIFMNWCLQGFLVAVLYCFGNKEVCCFISFSEGANNY